MNEYMKKSIGILKIFILICFILVCVFVVLFTKYLSKNKVYLNYSIDEKQETIILEGQEESITTRKYVSDLEYSMRYDIKRFKVLKNENQDVYLFVDSDEVFVSVEKSSMPNNCEEVSLENNYNNCYKYIDETKEEYYINYDDRTYKILIKTPGGIEYSEGVKARINYMINTFEISF